MEEVQPLAGLRPAVVGQPPEPYGTIRNDQRAGGLTQSVPQGFGVHLFAQAIESLTRGDRATLGDNGASTRTLVPKVQPETGAELNAHLAGFEGEFELFLLGDGLLIELGAPALGAGKESATESGQIVFMSKAHTLLQETEMRPKFHMQQSVCLDL